MLLSYTTAELWIRFIYDSIYIPWRGGKSIFSLRPFQDDESKFAVRYVTKLFRRRGKEDEAWKNLKNHIAHIRLNFTNLYSSIVSIVIEMFYYVYAWQDHYRSTTLVVCTYTVAFTFLYHVACIITFFYISQTMDYIVFFKSYIELERISSLNKHIIISAIVPFILFSLQLYGGMISYRIHKVQLYKGFCEEIPSNKHLGSYAIAVDSFHYPGYLIGYMAWGYIFCFHLIFIILTIIEIISFNHFSQILSDIILPVLIIYLINQCIVSLFGQFIFIRTKDKKPVLEKRKTHAIFLYFCFFAGKFYRKIMSYLKILFLL